MKITAESLAAAAAGAAHTFSNSRMRNNFVPFKFSAFLLGLMKARPTLVQIVHGEKRPKRKRETNFDGFSEGRGRSYP